MEKTMGTARATIVRLAGLVLASVPLLLWSTAAHAQSREDQYGSPTAPVEHAGRAAEALGVLPDTGGPPMLLVGAALILAGTGMALLGRR